MGLKALHEIGNCLGVAAVGDSGVLNCLPSLHLPDADTKFALTTEPPLLGRGY